MLSVENFEELLLASKIQSCRQQYAKLGVGGGGVGRGKVRCRKG